MKLPLSWIKERIDVEVTPHQIATMLTQAGLEVDSYAPQPGNFDNVVIGEVLRTEKHPNADSLCVATVTNGVESFQVVCGAPNCRKGMKTAFAMIGATLRSQEEKPLRVKKSKLRGVASFGMLCSEKELGLGEDDEGIMEFASHLSVGADVAEIYGDVIFEISLTPNLGHCASVVGVGRELSAATGDPIRSPTIRIDEEVSEPIDGMASVVVLDQKKCPRYACRVIRNVSVGPSPPWMQSRLLACDFRPVNNIVDITNYVLMEMGHPLHAFDYDRVEGGKIIVRGALEGETFFTLDDKERILSPEDLLICDVQGPIALAGVMGGKNCEVRQETNHVLLESAYFEAAGIRRTSKRLALKTEAARRFERGCDPKAVIQALDRAAMLIQEIAGGQVCKGVIDIKRDAFLQKSIACRLSRINQLLGTQLSLSEVETVFERLDMLHRWDGTDCWTVKPPTYRTDVKEEIDLIEEVGRIYGFENIPKKKTQFSSSSLPNAPIFVFEKEVRRRLLAEGLQEFVTCDLIGPSLLNLVKDTVMPQVKEVQVLNPTSIEQSVLRTSLLPGLLQVAKYNYDHGVHDISGFEIGRVHFNMDEKYHEQSVAALLLMGRALTTHWDSQERFYDFFDLKGMIENLLGELPVRVRPIFENKQLPIFHPGRQASIDVDSLKIGALGEVHPEIVRRLDIPQRIYFAEINLHDLNLSRKKKLTLKELPVFPGSFRDMTLTLDEKTPVQKILNALHSIPSRLLKKVDCISVYRSEKLKGKKNVTWRLLYRDDKKTVSQQAVDAEHARIMLHVETALVILKR